MHNSMKKPYQWMQATKTRCHIKSATIPFWKQPPQISSEWLLNDKHQMTSSPWKAPRLFQWLPMYEWKDMNLHHTSSSRQTWNEEPEPLNRKASIFERAGLQTIQWHPILRQFECPQQSRESKDPLRSQFANHFVWREDEHHHRRSATRHDVIPFCWQMA